MENRMRDEEVKIKISSCQKCNNMVRGAVLHKMTVKSRNDFAKEVMKYNLSVQEIPLLEYRANDLKWCDCKN